MITIEQADIIRAKMQRHLRSLVSGRIIVICKPNNDLLDITLQFPFTPNFYDTACKMKDKARNYFYSVHLHSNERKENDMIATLHCSKIKPA